MPELRIDVVVEETQYELPSDWRLLGAKGKAAHVVALCKKNGVEPKSLLEVGAGDGAILRSLAAVSFCQDMHAVEISKSGVDIILSQNIAGLRSCQVFDGYRLPFPDKAFDLVVLSHVLEHVEHERALLREISRVSRFQVIEIPMDSGALGDEIYHALGPSYGHINARSPDSLRFLLTTENMSVLDSQLGRYEMDLLEYDHFVNNSHQRTDTAVGKFRRRYLAADKKFSRLEGDAKVNAANYFAVLTRAETPDERIERGIATAIKAIIEGRIQASRLIFDHFVPPARVDESALRIAQGCINARPDIALEYLARISSPFATSGEVERARDLARAGMATFKAGRRRSKSARVLGSALRFFQKIR